MTTFLLSFLFPGIICPFLLFLVSYPLSLIALNIMNCISWHTECIFVGVPIRNILIEVQEALLWHRM